MGVFSIRSWKKIATPTGILRCCCICCAEVLWHMLPPQLSVVFLALHVRFSRVWCEALHGRWQRLLHISRLTCCVLEVRKGRQQTSRCSTFFPTSLCGVLAFGSVSRRPSASRLPSSHSQLVRTQLAHIHLVLTHLVLTQLAQTQLVITHLAHTQLAHMSSHILSSHNLVITQLAHTQLVLTQLVITQLAHSHTSCPHTTYNLLTHNLSTLRGRRDIW